MTMSLFRGERAGKLVDNWHGALGETAVRYLLLSPSSVIAPQETFAMHSRHLKDVDTTLSKQRVDVGVIQVTWTFENYFEKAQNQPEWVVRPLSTTMPFESPSWNAWKSPSWYWQVPADFGRWRIGPSTVQFYAAVCLLFLTAKKLLIQLNEADRRGWVAFFRRECQCSHQGYVQTNSEYS